MDNLHSNKKKDTHHYLQRILLNLFFLFTLVILIIINISSYYQVAKLDIANRLVIQTYQMTQVTRNLLLNMLDIESLTRGYLIVNNKSFVENLNEKINQIYFNLEQGKKLASTPTQQQKLQSLVPLFKEKIELAKKTILLKAQNKMQTQTAILFISNSQNLSKKIRAILLDINEKEFMLLAERNKNVLYNFHQLNFFIFSATAVSLLIIFISLIAFNRQFSRQRAAEDKLYKSEALLAGILDGTTDFIAAFDLNFRYIAFNKSYQDEFKRIFNKQLTVGMRLQEALAHLPDELEKAVEILKRAFNGEEFTIIRKFGSNAHDQSSYEITFSSIRDHNGNLIGASHISRNIEERIQAERVVMIANEKLKYASIRDPLTNLYNRSYMKESLEGEINRAERSRIMLAIIMIDLDHFKNINDSFGHQAGDLMLQRIGEVLLGEVRKSDTACRYGGEEFLLVLYDTSLNDAISHAEHIRKKISHTKFYFAAETIAITASLGLAIYPEHGQNMDELIRSADKALYESKKNGRNKVTVYQKQP